MNSVRRFLNTRRSFLSVGFGASLFAAILPKTAVAFVDESETAGPFVFSYFRGNGEDGLHLAWSNDGLVWQSLNGDNPLTSPVVGGKLMRDPSIVKGPEGTFHMVWSSGWWDRGFGYASSRDLIHWAEHRFIPANEMVPGAKNTWAPDLFYDSVAQQFVILFATTVPGRFPQTDDGGDHNHRMYAVTTRDFVTWSEPSMAFDPGHNCIDATLFIANNGVTMIYKDERPGHKRLHAVRAARFGEAWSAVTGPILDRDWVEGPSVFKVGDRWRLYFDCYSKGHYGAAESVDGIHWVDITAQLKMPEGARHGTAFPVTRDVLDRLLQLKPDK